MGETSTIVVLFFLFFFSFFLGGGGVVVPGAPEGSTGRLIFVVVFGDVFGEARDRTCDPWFTRRVT